MHRVLVRYVLLALLPSCTPPAPAVSPVSEPAPVAALAPPNAGFTVELAEDVRADPIQADLAARLVESGLVAAWRLLGEERIARLRGVRILVRSTSQEVRGPAAYHPTGSVAVEPGRYNTIEVNLAYYIEAVQRVQPYAMLHELVHAYEFLVLQEGNSPEVVALYEAAVSRGRYDAVPRLFARDVERHYGLGTHHEFLAEMSEAYLAVNDFFPHVASQLAAHDPVVYGFMEDLWGPVPTGETAPIAACGTATATTTTGATSTLRFVNLGARALEIGWLDDRGAFQAMETVASNAAAPMTTAGDHWFELRADGACVGQVQALDRAADAVIL
jgi:hypothetical protein